tara:strand:+ start:2511 stop:3629 length:1119 start_codon:yes stop_codon:yes gene_type:complete
MKKHRLNIYPEMKEEAYVSLKNDIEKNGYDFKFPIWIYEDEIIDGCNRYKACKELGIIPTYEKFIGDEIQAINFILRTNNRRDLTTYQRTLLALEFEEMFREKAKEKQKEGGGAVRQKSDKAVIDTKKELANIAKVSHDTISKVKKIEEKAPQEVKAKLATGEVSINAAYKEIKKEEKKEERIQLINKQIQDIEAGELPQLKGLFDVVSVDPPWNYEGENKNKTSFDSVGRRVANPYPEMSTQEIKQIELPLMEDSIVFLWTTHKFLPDALEILKEWNLEYKGTLVWNKEKMGMGAWFRMQCEFCLVGIKGKPYWENTKYRDILNEPRREHSRKPDSFFTMVEEITLGRRLEYFSREKRQGWEVFGNDINKF